jgi:hypothetical protein
MQLDSEVFEQLRKISWFSKCAKASNINFGFDNLEWAPNWSIATKYFTSTKWEDTTLQARNAITVHLSNRHQNDYQHWNKLTVQARDQIVKDIMPNILLFQQQSGLPPEFSKCVRWDLLAAVMESTYKRCNPPVFFSKLLTVYESGHFPCGWQGEWPNGHLVAV